MEERQKSRLIMMAVSVFFLGIAGYGYWWYQQHKAETAVEEDVPVASAPIQRPKPADTTVAAGGDTTGAVKPVVAVTPAGGVTTPTTKPAVDVTGGGETTITGTTPATKTVDTTVATTKPAVATTPAPATTTTTTAASTKPPVVAQIPPVAPVAPVWSAKTAPVTAVPTAVKTPAPTAAVTTPTATTPVAKPAPVAAAPVAPTAVAPPAATTAATVAPPATATPAVATTTTISGGTKEKYAATPMQDAIQAAGLNKGRPLPTEPVAHFLPWPTTKSYALAHAQGDASKLLALVPPPPPPSAAKPQKIKEKLLPPPPPSDATGAGGALAGLPIDQLPVPPSRPTIGDKVKVLGVFDDKAIIAFPKSLTTKNKWPRTITLGTGEQFESLTIISINRDGITIEEDGERSTKPIAGVK